MSGSESHKRIAADLMKCGRNRVRIIPSKDVDEALTREDIRNLIRKGLIRKVPKQGKSRAAAKKILAQKKKGRRKAAGSRKGKKMAKTPKKRIWVKTVTTQRSMIRELRDSGQIKRSDYRSLYMKVKGGMFRNRKHILTYVKEHEMLSKAAKPIRTRREKPSAKAAKPKAGKEQNTGKPKSKASKPRAGKK